jgi:hypothetical protein
MLILSSFFFSMVFQNSRHASRIVSKSIKAIEFLNTMEKIVPWTTIVLEIERIREKNE